MLNTSERKIRYLAFGAILGPIIFTIVVFTLAWIRPGYSHASQLMSELGETSAQNAIVMNTLGTPLLGVSIILFALALMTGLEKTKASQYGSIVVLLGGICLVLAGIFPCDPGCIPVTFTGKMHKTISNIGFTGIILAPFLLYYHFKKRITWKRYKLPTISVGVATLFLVPIYLLRVFSQWNGAIQRILLGFLLLWIEAISFKLIQEYQN